MKEKGRRFFIVSSSKEKKRCQAEHSACRTGQLQVFNFSHHNNNNNNIFLHFSLVTRKKQRAWRGRLSGVVGATKKIPQTRKGVGGTKKKLILRGSENSPSRKTVIRFRHGKSVIMRSVRFLFISFLFFSKIKLLRKTQLLKVVT